MIFHRRTYTNLTPREKPEIRKDLWVKCEHCGKLVYEKKWKENLKVCPFCGVYYRMTAHERVGLLAEPGSFKELWSNLCSLDPLGFVGVKSYEEKIREESRRTGLSEALLAGEARIGGVPVVLTVLDPHFLMGTMGSVVGEKFARACEHACARKVPMISVSGGGGGARMYEGLLSLMQMAKTSAAVGRLHRDGILYVSILTDPTMGGVAASFAFLGDIVVAEPGALIGFAGPRVIEQTIRQKLPPGFQRSEFLLKHGMVDMVVARKDLRATLEKLLRILH